MSNQESLIDKKIRYFDKNRASWKNPKPKVCSICFIVWGTKTQLREHKRNVHAY